MVNATPTADALLSSLAREYREYVAFAEEHTSRVMSVAEWYEQRDYADDEPQLGGDFPLCQDCGEICVPFTLELEQADDELEEGDPQKLRDASVTVPSWLCESCRLLWDDDQVFA